MLTRVRVQCSVVYAVCILLIVVVPGTAEAATLVVDDDGLAAVNNCNAVTPTFLLISAAVAAASPGDTIQVCPGNYVENIPLAKKLTLNGAQAGVDARGRVASESQVTPLVAANPTLTLFTGSADSVIDGFTFFGGTRAIVSDTGPIDRLQILNNRIQAFTSTGVFLDDAGIDITVAQNEVDGTLKTGGGGLVHLDTDNFDGFWFLNNNVINGLTGTGFFVDGNRNVDKSTAGARTPAFLGNLLSRNGTGTNLGRFAWGDGDIGSNTFSNNTFDGLQGGPRKARIYDNWFDANGRDGLALTGFGGTTDPTRGAQQNNIELNCFTRNGFVMMAGGIFLSSSQFPGTISTNVINQNNIVGNRVGLQYLGTEVIDARLNWWGSPSGPLHPTNPTGTGNAVVDSGTVDFDPWRTTPVAGTPCGVGPATTLTLDPVADTNPVDTMHCVTATVTNAFGIPQPGVNVQFTVSGSVSDTGVETTDGNGKATFCYQGPSLPGDDLITAIADADNEGDFERGEPTGVATKAWILPMTTPLCEIIITNGGWIIADNGDRGSFGGNAKADGESNVSGQEEYQDHGPADPFNLHGTPMVIVCNGDTQATIFGNATIDGTGSHPFRIDVQDNGEPGRGFDHYRIQVDTYDSGDHTLEGGNVQIRRQD